MKTPALSLFLALSAVACGSGSSGSACETNAGKAGHVCAVASESSGVGVSCEAPSVVVSSCPSTNALGTCNYTEDAEGTDLTETITYYSDGNGYTAATAQDQCSAYPKSTWTPAG